ncbi:MAG: nucleoside hydrolase [Armatimonadetes bacterium]|nr:nucleoside hydrolase [Armatimonadota bacterium]
MRIIIDTDIGESIDDLLAVAFALNSPELEVVAITTVSGDTQARSRIARRLTSTFGKPDIPVAAGHGESIPRGGRGIHREASVTQGRLAADEAGLPEPSPLPADELIAGLAAEQPGEIYVLTIGAMTNVGHALVRFPETALNLRGVVSSGGHFATTPVSIGWNLRDDPIAAAVTACADVDWTLLSEGLMSEAPLREEDIQRIREAGLPTTDLIAEAIELWQKNAPDGATDPCLDDLTVFFHLLDPGSIPMRGGRAIIAVAPDRIAELWVEHDPAGPHTLARPIDQPRAEELRDLFMSRILAPPPG